MPNLICKYYFLEGAQRTKMENALLNSNKSEDIDDILKLDDHEIVHLYNECVKEQSRLNFVRLEAL